MEEFQLIKKKETLKKATHLVSSIGILIFLGFIFSYCSTEKNTPVRRSYHNLTSYYNILFNGKESFKEGMERYESSFRYDFTRTLPVFIYGEKKLSANIKPQMERAITKASKLVKLHSITAKPEKLEEKRKLTKEEKAYYNKSEFNRFVDDSYLLMGKAYFWEMDYQTASKILEYAINEFKDEVIEVKNQIWLTRSYIELGNFREAGQVLGKLVKAENLSRQLKAEFNATYADYHIKQDQQKQAIPYLQNAITYLEEKERKARYKFILAQLWEETERPEAAFNMYGEIIEMNPDYRIEFNAKLKRAWLHEYTDSQKGESIKEELRDMLHDDKNNDYQDRIYYALGKISLEENNMGQAIKNFKHSATKSTKNVNQKGLSYLELADIYFDQKKYEQAQAYYDSSVTFLETNYPGYTDLYIKTKYLTKLVENLNTIQYQDSLQAVAKMNSKERNQLINRLINEYEKRQREKQEAERIRRENQAMQARNNRMGGRNRQGSGWYFYSQTAKERGQASFMEKWGSRKLKDNWRLSNKQSGQFADMEEEAAKQEDPKEQFSKTNRKYYTQDIPLTDSAKKASHEKIKKAYFNVGMVYMNDLENYPKAIDAFQQLNDNYPGNSFELPSYYHMYKMFKELGDAEQTDKYKQKILAKYPETNYAKVVTDPDYFKKLEEQQNVLERTYATLLEKYKNGQYYTVINECRQAMEKFENKPYLARFSYLKALSVGKTQDIVSFRKALKHVSKTYPDTEVAKAANDKLNFLEKTELQQLSAYFTKNRNQQQQKQQQQQQEKEDKAKTAEQKDQETVSQEGQEEFYKFKEGEQYYFVIIANTKNIDIGKLKFDLINFNLDYYLQEDYTTASKNFNEYNTIISVKRFKDLKTVQEYYDILTKKEERVFKEIDNQDYKYFYISVKNYTTLLEKKSIIEYIKFFKNNLLNQN